MKPLIGVPTDIRIGEVGMAEHRVAEKYPRAVVDAARCMPVLMPVWDWDADVDALLDRLDGIMLTGARSNVHPDNYGSTDIERAAPFDQQRDSLTLPIIRKCVERGMPLFAICRGFQELNVALGGSLHPKLQEVEGRFDHRMPKSEDMEIRYAAVHPIKLLEGGFLHRLIGESEVMINSLHGQGVNELADGLVSEGVADDGTVEAVSVRNAKGFALGVQWHPEYRPNDNAISRALFTAFGDAARSYAARQRDHPG